jgi:hypothetical protein
VPGKRKPLAAVALASSSSSASASAFSSSASVAGSGSGSLAGRRSVSNGVSGVGGIRQRHHRRLPPGANVAGAAVFGVQVDVAAVAEARRAAEAQRHRFLDADGNDEQDEEREQDQGYGNGNGNADGYDAGELRQRGARESRAVGQLGAVAVGDASAIECVRATTVQLAETETRVHMLLLRAQNARLQSAAGGASNLSLVLASNKAASVRMTAAATAAAASGGMDGGSAGAASASSSSSSSSSSSALSIDGTTYGMNAFDAFFTFADKSVDVELDGASLMLVNDASRQVALPLLHATVGATRVTAAALTRRLTVLARSSAAVQVSASF